MIKVIRTCRYSNGGKSFNLLPAILVTPLYGVAQFFTPAPLSEFPDPARTKKMYPVVGVWLGCKLWTYHVGIELRLRSFK